ncbi:MAG: Restriction endonuclease S subunit [Chloroflexi bacterium AL-W]|nr:Restriction endonuclease S subunit [Chloroflexi bacterium AL-N1]NOK67956.1 Restriction endonuclease S subunit [Chloroflexi bacterium AL-N10]NOK73296.1 Restriction endonuclease S subunit [Chloroflexi bacterium AL-N5]NOK83210.1 Restriction endonuclease S subunit [Chloroflexi bacterium AL-W]NOK87627.1 Restriction endonuclease S subunit [Chloroflexi bacterium AL-N15]
MIDENVLNMHSEVPKNWVLTTIGNICDINPRVTWPENFTDDTKVSFVPMAAVDEISGTITNSEVKPISEVWQGYTRFLEGDVLFAKITPSMENGKAAIATNLTNGIGLGTTEFHVLSATDLWVAKWIYYYIRQEVFRKHAARKMTGSAGQLRVPIDYLAEGSIPLAPHNEIKRIVDEIEFHFSRLDAWLETMQKLLKKLTRLRASILKAAVEGRLVTQDPNDESAEVLLQRIVDERRRKWEDDYLADLKAKGKPAPNDDRWKEKYKEPEAPYLEDLPILPVGWVWACIGWIAEVQGGIQKQPKRIPKDNVYPYLRVANVYRNFLDLSQIYEFELFDGELEKYRLEFGDVLIVEGNGSIDQIGRCALWGGEINNCVHQNHIIRARLNHTLPEYVSYFLNSSIGMEIMAKAAVTTSGLYTLSVSKIKDITIPLPPKNEQKRIVDAVNECISILDRIQEIIRINVKRGQRMRQSILEKAFEGRLVEQHSGDEPASELLERIRAERKRRTEEEKRKPKQQRERKVRTTKEVKKPLYDTLKEAGKPLSASDLFQQAGFSRETIDDFYEQLRQMLRETENIRVQRKNDDTFLEVVR